MRHQLVLLDHQDGSRAQQVIAIGKIYYEDYRHLYHDPEFCRFIFALCTRYYLEGNNFKARPQRQLIQTLLSLGLECQDCIPESHVYLKDRFVDDSRHSTHNI